MSDVKITALPPALAVSLDDLVAIVNDPSGSPETQRAALNQFIYFTKVLTAYIGGDQTGNARGAYATDVQSYRTLPAQVASGASSSAFGYSCDASGKNATAVGFYCIASGAYSAAMGWGASATAASSFGFGSGSYATGPFSSASGFNANASASYASAFGYMSRARIVNTTNLGGPLINRKDDGEASAKSFYVYGGSQVVLMTKEISLKTVADTTITLPAGCHFFPTEVGVIVTSANTVTVQPTVRFGFTGTPAGWVAAGATTGLIAAFDRNRFTALVSVAGQTSAVGGVTVGATATTLLGRFYFAGLLIEDE